MQSKKTCILFLSVAFFSLLKGMETLHPSPFDHDEISFIDLNEPYQPPGKENNKKKKEKMDPAVEIQELLEKIRGQFGKKKMEQPPFFKDIVELKIKEGAEPELKRNYQGLAIGLECFLTGLMRQRGSLTKPGEEHIDKAISSIKREELKIRADQKNKSQEKSEEILFQISDKKSESIKKDTDSNNFIKFEEYPNREAWRKAARFQEKRSIAYLTLSKLNRKVFQPQDLLNHDIENGGTTYYAMLQKEIFACRKSLFKKSEELIKYYKAPLLQRITHYFVMRAKINEIDDIRKKIIEIEKETDNFYKKNNVRQNIFQSNQKKRSLGLSQLLEEDILSFRK
jgi:hypothetical protein